MTVNRRSGMEKDHEVTIYVTTMRADYRHAKALIASIEALSTCRRILIVPDDDYVGDTMFGYPVWRPTDARVLALDGFYKKLRVFWGPAERFMHCDADQLVLRDLDPYLQYLGSRPAPFFAANLSRRVLRDWDEGDKRHVFVHRAGDPELLRRFDADYDWQARLPFNSGEFSASRDAIDHGLFLDVFERARSLHAAQFPSMPMTRSRKGMFMSDQGFLNYFVYRCCPNVDVEWIDDLYWWGGCDESIDHARDRSGPFTGTLIHWAGCTRPGPIPLGPRAPRSAEWRRHHRAYCRNRRDYAGFVADAWDHVWRSARDTASRLKRSLLAAGKRPAAAK